MGFDRRLRTAAAAVAAAFLSGTAIAQSPLQGQFDPAVPTLAQTVGHATGTRISSPDEITRYLEALAAAAPDRTRLVRYATSWEGRPLHYLVISSPQNIARLAENQAAMARLAAGSGDIGGVVPVTWLAYGVHGDEISSSDAGLALAYYLLAAQGDERAATILERSIVVIDPSQNPDGRGRFVQHYRTAAGIAPTGDRHAAEHVQQWPGGRYNHYLFDLNRDWFALTQPETRGKIAALRDWNPVVLVDAHEMGGDSTYYFPPAADPFNPNITPGQRDKQALLGRGVAAWFDDIGVDYFTREVFDAFYPGYGDTWPTLQGAVAATFEQSSARGLVWTRTDGSELTYGEGVRNHMIASLSYAETVARNAERFLGDYAAYRREAAAAGGGSYLIDLSQRRWNAETLGRRLAFQGIAVERIDRSFSACGRNYPAGALAVPRGQPAGRLVRTLLDPDTPLPADFVAEQEARRDRGQPHELYDTTAWSLGAMGGLDVVLCGSAPTGAALAADEPIATTASVADGDAGRFGVAVPWTDTGQAQLVLAALREGLSARAAGEDFSIGGRPFPRGTAVFQRGANGAEGMARLAALARSIGAETVALEESWIEEGPSIGSESFVALAAPKVAMAWDGGLNPLSAGAWRYVVEQRLATPVTPIRTDTLARADLAAYDVLIVPEARLDNPAALAVQRYVREGGVAVIVSSGLDAFTKGDARLFATGAENALGEVAEEEDEGSDERESEADAEEEVEAAAIASEADYRAFIQNDEADPDTLPGALLNTVADPDHYLTSGYPEGPVVHADGSTILAPLNERDGTNVVRFAGPQELVEAGYVWAENRSQMAFKPYLMAQPTGEGLAIGFTHDPATRGYLEGLDLLIANAILFAPARER